MQEERKPLSPFALSCRVLARLLDYPGEELLAALPALLTLLREQGSLSSASLAEIEGLVLQLARGDRYEVQARYVETFDRGRATSLHLFEHVHGDSRERGPALVDLARTYEQAGLFFEASELPDYLPAVLEFASTQPEATARSFLAEMAHILNNIHAALLKREQSAYAAALAAVLELAGERPQAPTAPAAAEESLDESWVEPAAFDGCSSQGQNRPGQAQPIHIVKKNPASQGVRP